VLSLVLSGVSAGSWADYGAASATQAMAGVSLACIAAGFDRVGGQAARMLLGRGR
jgi:hypothetical protein